MLKTVEGTFRRGRVELEETPAEAEGAHVLVTFLPPTEPRSGAQTMRLGMLRVEGARESQWDDFAAAKRAWRND